MCFLFNYVCCALMELMFLSWIEFLVYALTGKMKSRFHTDNFISLKPLFSFLGPRAMSPSATLQEVALPQS